MASKSKYHVFTKKQRVQNRIPVIILYDNKVNGRAAAKKLLNELIGLKEPYIEVHDTVKEIKTVYTKASHVKNYTKKEYRL